MSFEPQVFCNIEKKLPNAEMLQIIVTIWALQKATVLHMDFCCEMYSLCWDTWHSFMLRGYMQALNLLFYLFFLFKEISSM